MKNIIEITPATLRKPEPLRALPAPKRSAPARRLNPLAEKRRAEDPCTMVRLLNEWQDDAYWKRAEQEQSIKQKREAKIRAQRERDAQHRAKQEREARILSQRDAAIVAKEWAELKANLWTAAAVVIAMGAILWQVLV